MYRIAVPGQPLQGRLVMSWWNAPIMLGAQGERATDKKPCFTSTALDAALPAHSSEWEKNKRFASLFASKLLCFLGIGRIDMKLLCLIQCLDVFCLRSIHLAFEKRRKHLRKSGRKRRNVNYFLQSYDSSGLFIAENQRTVLIWLLKMKTVCGVFVLLCFCAFAVKISPAFPKPPVTVTRAIFYIATIGGYVNSKAFN